MQQSTRTATEIFNEFKQVFTEFPFENLERFIGYCETHARTQRALFSTPQVLLLNVLNGQEQLPIEELKKKMDAGDYVEFTPIHGDDMDIILEPIKAQIN